MRSDPALPAPEEVDFLGPRDDTAPLLEHIDPSSLSPIPAAAGASESVAKQQPSPESGAAAIEAVVVDEPAAESVLTAPSAPSAHDTTLLRIAPRTAFVAGLAVIALVMLAALVGFFAGRPHP